MDRERLARVRSSVLSGFRGKYVKELTRLLQLYLTREVCLENLNLLYYIRLLAHVLGDSRLKGYYDCLSII